MKNVFAIILIILGFIALPTHSNAQMPRVGKTYYIQSIVSSNRYLSTKNGGTSTRTRVVIDQKKSRNLKATQWKMENVGGGYYRFIQKSSGKALDVSGVRTAAKTPLWIWPKSNPGEAQKFRLKDGGNGYYYIIPKINDNMRLDVEGSRSTAGTGVWTFPRNGSRTQKWKFIEVSSSTRTPKQARYQVELISLKCLEEDDPGSEIEMYGVIEAKVSYNGRDRSGRGRSNRAPVNIGTLLNVQSSQAIDLDEGEVYNARNARYEFNARKDHIEAGSYTIELGVRMYEHDDSSRNDKFTIRENLDNKWTRRDGLPITKTLFIVEGRSKVEVKWRVSKVGVKWRVSRRDL